MTQSKADIISQWYQALGKVGGKANTDAQNKARLANLSKVRAKRGRKPTCACGSCPKCKMRQYQQKRREQQKKG